MSGFFERQKLKKGFIAGQNLIFVDAKERVVVAAIYFDCITQTPSQSSGGGFSLM